MSSSKWCLHCASSCASLTTKFFATFVALLILVPTGIWVSSELLSDLFAFGTVDLFMAGLALLFWTSVVVTTWTSHVAWNEWVLGRKESKSKKD
jgi:hypothetical protein